MVVFVDLELDGWSAEDAPEALSRAREAAAAKAASAAESSAAHTRAPGLEASIHAPPGLSQPPLHQLPSSSSSRPGSSGSCFSYDSSRNGPMGFRPGEGDGLGSLLAGDGLPAANADHRLALTLDRYPTVTEIARHVDANTLENLSATCRRIYTSLFPNRSLLIKKTLRCVNERRAQEAAADGARSGTDAGSRTLDEARLLAIQSMSSSRCVRDLVKQCMRCHQWVCRNCIGKPYTSAKPRIRRLCRTCIDAPLSTLTQARSVNPYQAFAHPSAYLRAQAARWGLCCCAEEAWLCLRCTRAQHNEDTTYRAGWAWRANYRSVVTPYGTWAGIGVGDDSDCRGRCGRASECLAAKDVVVEAEVRTASDGTCWSYLAASQPEQGGGGGAVAGAPIPAGVSLAVSVSTSTSTAPHGHQPGYFRQEYVGAGQVIRSKSLESLLVGDVVDEYPGERESGDYLLPEIDGDVRSWCGWCRKVIPSKADLQRLEEDQGQR
ncbi:hypothetical protein KEM52_000414 [Ascosphaera acerosa]|nr:hypothetical protein KEM52_000414 [Ascosphaera acerosa]